MIAYITGTSSGIGKALALKLLQEGHKVIGIARTCSINQSNYSHVTLDLSDLKAVAQFDFPTNITDDVVLVNNAGIVGQIKPVGHQVEADIIKLNNVNVIAPQILINKFVHKFQPLDQQYQIITISSGAGKYPIDAWAAYCASKAAMDLFSETVFQELKARNFNNWHVFAIAPGVVDTGMQEAIRASNPKDFLNHNKFVELKTNNELASSDKVGEVLYRIIENPRNHSKVVFSLRDLE